MLKDLNFKIFFIQIKFTNLLLVPVTKLVIVSNMSVVIVISKAELHSSQMRIKVKLLLTLANLISRLFLVHAPLIHQNSQHELIPRQKQWKKEHRNSKLKKRRKRKSRRLLLKNVSARKKLQKPLRKNKSVNKNCSKKQTRKNDLKKKNENKKLKNGNEKPNKKIKNVLKGNRKKPRRNVKKPKLKNKKN